MCKHRAVTDFLIDVQTSSNSSKSDESRFVMGGEIFFPDTVFLAINGEKMFNRTYSTLDICLKWRVREFYGPKLLF